MLFLDLDNFKMVNDTLGHHSGDLLLAQLADRLRTCTRETDLVARQGGDEFLLLLADLDRDEAADEHAALATAEMVANRVREALAEPFDLHGTQFLAAARSGSALFPHDAQDAETLMKNADAAMYRTKRTEPGSFTSSRRGPRPRHSGSRSRRGCARRSARSGGSCTGSRSSTSATAQIGAEALIRWRDAERRARRRREFIPLAEELG